MYLSNLNGAKIIIFC